MKELTAVDVQIIATGMKINRLERELYDGRDYAGRELSSGWRKLRQDQLNAMRKRYKRLVKQNNKFDEYGYYLEKQAERQREEKLLNQYE